jgi:hypothetical protein
MSFLISTISRYRVRDLRNISPDSVQARPADKAGEGWPESAPREFISNSAAVAPLETSFDRV